MFDRFDRRIDYLRVSVTDRCNLRCAYCMPEAGIPLLPREAILSFEEIRDVVETAVGMGVTKVRLTGGEPLIRADVVTLVSMIAEIRGIRDLAMSTNGVLLADHADALARAGLQRVNISLDALDPERYAVITRGGDVRRVIEGIHAALAAGLRPVKLNCVVHQSPEEPDARQVAQFAEENGAEVRFIRRMSLASGEFYGVVGGAGGDCKRCNRLRLSCDGMVRPCLFGDVAFSVRELGPREAIRRAVEHKPASGSRSEGAFYAIGG